MARSVAVLGAGGKMGLRVTRKLHEAGYDLRAAEIGEAARGCLAEAGIRAVPQLEALAGAEVVVLALPDAVIGDVARDILPDLAPGAMLLILDAAAPYAGAIPDEREDVSLFVGHPCHPPLYNEETEWDARRDYHGGIARQAIVCALMRGPEEHYALGEEICRPPSPPHTG